MTESSKAVATRLDPDRLAHLEEQRDFLLASLADLEREHEAGDLDDADYAELRDDYTARAAETMRAIDEHRDAFESARRPRNRRRTLAVVVGVGVFALLAGLAVSASLGARKAGETSSGGITVKQTATQRAQACIPKVAPPPKNPKPAIDCFTKILNEDRENAVALTWLAWQSSLIADQFDAANRSKLERAAADYLDQAVEYDPSYSYGWAFRAVVAYRNGDPVKARKYLEDFRSHDPAADAQAIIRSMDLEANIDLLERITSSSTTTPGATTTSAPAAPTTTTPG